MLRQTECCHSDNIHVVQYPSFLGSNWSRWYHKASFLQGSKDLEKCHQNQNSTLQGELRKEMALLQKRILMDTVSIYTWTIVHMAMNFWTHRCFWSPINVLSAAYCELFGQPYDMDLNVQWLKILPAIFLNMEKWPWHHIDVFFFTATARNGQREEVPSNHAVLSCCAEIGFTLYYGYWHNLANIIWMHDVWSTYKLQTADFVKLEWSFPWLGGFH